MFNVQNATVRNFVCGFENKFGIDLMRPDTQYHASQKIRTQYFVVQPGEAKFSDFDVYVRLKNGGSVELLQSMERYIRKFDGFSEVGLILTNDPMLTNTDHHIDKKNYLHLMAFLPQESAQPFIDIHIENINNHLLSDIHTPDANKEFKRWIMLTFWRKIKNGKTAETDEYTKDLVKHILLPLLTKEEQVLLCRDPVDFLQKSLHGEAVRYLSLM